MCYHVDRHLPCRSGAPCRHRSPSSQPSMTPEATLSPWFPCPAAKRRPVCTLYPLLPHHQQPAQNGRSPTGTPTSLRPSGSVPPRASACPIGPNDGPHSGPHSFMTVGGGCAATEPSVRGDYSLAHVDHSHCLVRSVTSNSSDNGSVLNTTSKSVLWVSRVVGARRPAVGHALQFPGTMGPTGSIRFSQ